MKNKEVILTIGLNGIQKIHGKYGFERAIGSEGESIQLTTIKKPEFTQCSKSIRLNNDFVMNSINSVPPELKNKVSFFRWKGMSQEERLKIAIENYVNSVSIDHRSYSYEVI